MSAKSGLACGLAGLGTINQSNYYATILKISNTKNDTK